jgi:protein phosphatase
VSVRVQCPHCRSICQIDDRHVGSPVKCGKCAKPFTLLTSATQSAPAESSPVKPKLALPDDDLPFELDGPAAGTQEPGSASSATRPKDTPLEPLGLECLDIGAATSPGRVRERNEDSFLVQRLHWSNLDSRREMALVVVADGMGGHDAGDVASGMAIRSIGGSLLALFTDAMINSAAILSTARLSDAVAGALHEANHRVVERAKKQPNMRGMGATVAVILIANGQAIIGHIGDCRVYHATGEELRQVTSDQTLVARMVELGQLSEEEAMVHPSRNEVTHALGRFPDLSPSLIEVKLASGDWLIAASDGLQAHVRRSELQNAVNQARSAMSLAHHLVRLADQGGGSDNCTVAAIRLC